MRHARALGLLVCVFGVLAPRAPTERIAANDNRMPAGSLEHGVLTLHLRITHGDWHPDADDAPGTDALAFAEEGRAPSVPGPLIRVPAGTEVRSTVHNTLDTSVVVFGLSGARGLADSVRIPPGETRELVTRATTPGTFMYRGLTRTRSAKGDPRPGSDGMLGGAFIVDPPGAAAPDRVFVIFQWIDSLRLRPRGDEGGELLTINGRSWPNTERLQYQLGDTIRWRVINASFDAHPMHLHGAYFTVLSRGAVNADTTYSAAGRRQVVTERMLSLTTMTLQWVPVHAGNWLFHCHLNFHLMPHAALAPPEREVAVATGPSAAPLGATVHAGMHTLANAMPLHSMGGLVLGVTVHGPVAVDARPRRHLRLAVEQYDSTRGDAVPPFSFETNGTRAMTIPGAPIIVTQHEPIAITVVNHASEPTSVHWHGLEIESYYDGVAGFDGDPARLLRPVPPHDSFVVYMTPPRAGTFIYHSHYDDIRQQGGGLYGAFIVLRPGEKWDPAHERLVVLGEARTLENLEINGVDHPTITLVRGQTYRLRFINITLDRPAISVTLAHGDTLAEWRPIARDGADLPPDQALPRLARLPITIGETDDVLFTPSRAGTYALDVRKGNGTLLRSAAVVVTEPSAVVTRVPSQP